VIRRVLFAIALVAGVFPVWIAAGAAPGSPARTPHDAGLKANFDGDGFADAAVGAPFEKVGSDAEAGQVVAVYGASGGADLDTAQILNEDSSGLDDTSDPGDEFGSALATGDFDHDGFTDLAVGAPGDGGDIGKVFIVNGSSQGLNSHLSLRFVNGQGGVPAGGDSNDRWGQALAAGDFDGDGFADLAASARVAGGASNAGEVVVLYGSVDGLETVGADRFDQNSTGIPGTRTAGNGWGSSLAAGDLNGDGRAELVVGATGETVGGEVAAGSVTVLFGTAGGLSGAGAKRFTLNSPGFAGDPEQGGAFGAGLALGNFGKGARKDLAIGEPGRDVGTHNSAGALWVLYGGPGGIGDGGIQKITEDSPNVMGTSANFNAFGVSLAAANYGHSSLTDLAVGSPLHKAGGVPGAGAVIVLYGSTKGLTGTNSQIWSPASAGLHGSDNPESFGRSVAAGNLGHDSRADLLIGAPDTEVPVSGSDVAKAGAAYVVYGTANGLASAGAQRFTEQTPQIAAGAVFNEQFGRTVAVGR